MDQDTRKDFIITGNLWKVMWQMSWPAVIAMVLYGLNMVFDAIFVGQFVGENALAGVSIAYPLSMISQGFGSLVGVGAGSLLSIVIGAGDRRKQERLMGNVNYLSLVISILYMAVTITFAAPLVKMMGGEGAELAEGVAYFRVTAFGALLWIHGLALNMIVRAEGKMKSAAVMMGIGMVVNILFNTLFIVVLDFGVRGAAWGTNIGMAVYVLLGFAYFKGKRVSFPAKPFQIHRDADIVKSILSMGASSLIMTVMTLLQSVVVYRALAKYGSVFELAFYGAIFRIFNLLLTPIFGLMRALQPVVGINFGAGENRRVVRCFWIFAVASFVLILPLWIFVMAAPNAVLGLMFPSAVMTAASLANYRIFLSVVPFLPIVFMAMTFYPAIDKGGPAALIGIIRQLVFYVPVMLILPRLFGVRWVYSGSLLIDITVVIIALAMLFPVFGKLKNGTLKYDPKKHGDATA